jgi:hypothetical protein
VERLAPLVDDNAEWSKVAEEKEGSGDDEDTNASEKKDGHSDNKETDKLEEEEEDNEVPGLDVDQEPAGHNRDKKRPAATSSQSVHDEESD